MVLCNKTAVEIKMSYIGRCLCGQIEFQIQQNIQAMYHCHCSLCRKQSGTESNAATLIQAKYLEWLHGQHLIQSYQKDSGFRVDFCRHCGSAVPNLVGQTTWMWIPLGLLEPSPTIQQRYDFCVHSKVNWARPAEYSKSFDGLPEIEQLKAMFQLDET